MTAAALVDAVAAAGGVLALKGDALHYRLPNGAARFVHELREQKADVLAVVRGRGGRVANFPHCPLCASYCLWRSDAGLYECQTCGLVGIEESTARRLIEDGAASNPG